MTNKFIDFDAFRAEQDREPVKFQIGGVTYDLPPSLPASVAVDVIRMKQTIGDDAEVPIERIVEFCEAVFGSDLWKAVQDRHRLTLDELPTLLSMVLETYTDQAGADPKAESQTLAKKAPSSRSSRAGRGSKRTS